MQCRFTLVLLIAVSSWLSTLSESTSSSPPARPPSTSRTASAPSLTQQLQKAWTTALMPMAVMLGGYMSFEPIQPVAAADTVKIGACLLKNCQLELGRCLLDPKCLANIICLNTCNDKADEVGCQIRCGDLFENEVVGQFNACALSKKQCVTQKPVRKLLWS